MTSTRRADVPSGEAVCTTGSRWPVAPRPTTHVVLGGVIDPLLGRVVVPVLDGRVGIGVTHAPAAGLHLLQRVPRAGRDERPEELFEPDADAAQQRLGAALLAWRREVDSEPIGELVSVERASAALAAGRPKCRPRLSLALLAAAAALLVIVCSRPGRTQRHAR